ncbi:MAG: uracil-DNA glycosylase [Chloroflexota bacterium]|nr:uracil-DNA glycosylase [Chloroflexota bacterium]
MSALSELYKEIAACRRCDLAKSRTRPVPGEGPENAEIMFIGEAPGWHEDQQGRPFVGPAGQYLDSLLALINLKREQVYITNVVKSRPPGNREPLPAEITACHQWLERQMEIIHPRMIITLGRYSLGKFFPGESISKVHGTARKRDGVIYFAMYHPAAALHQQSLRPVIEQDVLKIPPLLARTESVTETKSPPQQLNLFG